MTILQNHRLKNNSGAYVNHNYFMFLQNQEMMKKNLSLKRPVPPTHQFLKIFSNPAIFTEILTSRPNWDHMSLIKDAKSVQSGIFKNIFK